MGVPEARPSFAVGGGPGGALADTVGTGARSAGPASGRGPVEGSAAGARNGRRRAGHSGSRRWLARFFAHRFSTSTAAEKPIAK